MQITVYRKFEGCFKIIEENYEKRKDLFTKYTLEDLKDWKKLDLYFILDLEFLRDKKIEDSVLKHAYRRRILKYHPDTGKYGKEAFLAIKNAYTTLLNPVLRKQYDSFYFDDTLPLNKDYTEEEFYEVFGEAFKRNSKFSVIQPVPSLGNQSTSLQEIENFYKFWKNFETWRTFSWLEDEETESVCESTRNPTKLSKGKIKKIQTEYIFNIKNFTDLSIKKDPRLNKNTNNSSTHTCLITDGWTENEIKTLIKLLKENKGKDALQTVNTKFYKETGIKKSTKEVLVKCIEIKRVIKI
ncbi:hypothetical protein CWI38_2360p0010 [Hamiltosporidium tvaerminnensis]|uniref:J domain-containing protein n=2 Tax=Hamiltosporidium TaxID=1176354 RepID=A0A4Q9KXR2_9MICR|nr:DnaJ (Hsp40), sub C, member 2 [Hamiltosporidium tvaerminnensis]TBT97014.1 hypothetical protein CWI37_2569p0010 [Hamiltosporidium tvaerminnensis]TBT99190.1 hypothetical protein CWI39_2108p0010 [Hamiltosporidium magnivora]TBU01216.1 hypothetical protein CWI36_1406p0010 [Hamiltosporidium magnivora]TBU07726.1 hypothetical protein CWI38_2360p0010 [Hamiltosporidium tvaerminnensis]